MADPLKKKGQDAQKQIGGSDTHFTKPDLPTPGEEESGVPQGHVHVSYGVHSGTYPIQGLTFDEAKKSLQKLLNLDPSAVPVIDGEIVEDLGETIGVDIDKMHWVKPSAVKGAARAKVPSTGIVEKTPAGTLKVPSDAVIITGKNVYDRNGKGLCELRSLLDKYTETQADISPTEYALPRHVVWHAKRKNTDVFILELDPTVHNLLWLGDRRSLSIPYVVLKVPFINGMVYGRTELFYRREPLESLDDTVFWPNLLNTSPNSYGVRNWLCTQYLHTEGHDGTMRGQLHALAKHLWGGGFNRSSDENEGMSGFSLHEDERPGTPLGNTDLWEEATAENPRFIVEDDSVPFITVPDYGGQNGLYEVAENGRALTIKSIIETAFEHMLQGAQAKKAEKSGDLKQIAKMAN